MGIEIIESALESYRHYERMRLLNDSFRKLRANTAAWKEEEERRILEGTLTDGLEEVNSWITDFLWIE